MQPKIPKITVIMPVYNTGLFLKEAMDSILSQTYSDFEFIVIDDASTDDSLKIAQSYKDRRIRLIRNSHNIGVTASLNRGMELAKGEFIARMDGDDICAPSRFEKQLHIMEKYPQIGICGSWVKTKGSNGKGHVIRFPTEVETIRSFILFNNPVNHPVVMMRRAMLEKNSLRYDESFPAAQDYDFWSRCLQCFDFMNSQEILLTWRINKTGMTHRRFAHSNETVKTVQKRELQRLNIGVDEEELEFHRNVGNSTGVSNLETLVNARFWLDKLIYTNSVEKVYPSKGLERAAARVWFNKCVNSSGLGIKVLREYMQPSYFRAYLPPLTNSVYFMVNSIVRLRKNPVGKLMGSR